MTATCGRPSMQPRWSTRLRARSAQMGAHAVARDEAGRVGCAQEGGNELSVRATLDALKFPRREALNVNVELIEAGVVAVVFELNLKLQLIPRDGLAADRAERTDPWPAPSTIGSFVWQLSSANHFLGFRAQNLLVGHGNSLGSGGVVMPDARRPGRLFTSPEKPDRRQVIVYIFRDRRVRGDGEAETREEKGDRAQGGLRCYPPPRRPLEHSG